MYFHTFNLKNYILIMLNVCKYWLTPSYLYQPIRNDEIHERMMKLIQGDVAMLVIGKRLAVDVFAFMKHFSKKEKKLIKAVSTEFNGLIQEEVKRHHETYDPSKLILGGYFVSSCLIFCSVLSVVFSSTYSFKLKYKVVMYHTALPYRAYEMSYIQIHILANIHASEQLKNYIFDVKS